jgi:hypothetical protein
VIFPFKPVTRMLPVFVVEQTLAGVGVAVPPVLAAYTTIGPPPTAGFAVVHFMAGSGVILHSTISPETNPEAT